ncbi:MAG: hypothetical protein ACUVQM_06800 [Candidatus Hadarchaeaceae archaeon]
MSLRGESSRIGETGNQQDNLFIAQGVGQKELRPPGGTETYLRVIVGIDKDETLEKHLRRKRGVAKV